MTGLLILAILGVASAGHFGDHGHGQEFISEPSPIYRGPGQPVPVITQTEEVSTVRVRVNGVVLLDGHACILRGGEVSVKGPDLAIGDSAIYEVGTGFANSRYSGRFQIDGGLVYATKLSPTDVQGVTLALAEAGMTMQEFIQQIGTIPPGEGITKITAGVISINGVFKNIKLGVFISIDIPELVGGPAITVTGHLGHDTATIRVRTNGVVFLDGHACILRGGEGSVTGPDLAIGESGVYEVGTGFANSRHSGRFLIDDGLVYVTKLSPTDVQGVTLALTEAGMTLEEFIQQTGTIPPQEGIFKITAGILSINGVYRNVDVGVFIAIEIEGRTPQPITGPVYGPDLIITETAAHYTQTIHQPVTLTKTRTVDRYITITSPVYNSAAATITNYVKQTVTIPEDQVIRSPLPGRVVVNTVPEVSHTILTVTDTSTQFYVQTALDTVTSTLQHFAPNFNFRTVTVNNPQTSTVVQLITRTSVTSVYVTNTVGRTFYSTATVVITVTASPGYY